jgi:survival-of-motor-neuron-related-splicing factor 30
MENCESVCYRADGSYPAKINAVTGSQESPLYTITFKGYSSSTNVPLSSLRPHDPNAPIPQPQKRQIEQLSERDKERKKKKGEKWMETQQARSNEVKEKKTAWEKFGKKAHKKGIHISGYVNKEN